MYVILKSVATTIPLETIKVKLYKSYFIDD